MRLEKELPAVVQAFEAIKRHIPAHVELVKAAGNYKDLETRIAWDLLYATKGSAWICELYSKYDCVDDHISTLARRALRQVYPISQEVKLTCFACGEDVTEGVWIDGGTWTFYCLECFHEAEEQFPSWEHAEKRYLTKDNNTRDNWKECIWCNTISHDSLIEYDDNGKEVCPECKRAGAMEKV
jgi:hypothetical protein